MPEIVEVSAAVRAALVVFRKVSRVLSGTQYSSDEQRRLERLKDKYTFHLEFEGAPLEWELDDAGSPTHVRRDVDWVAYTRRAIQKKGWSGVLHNYVATVLGFSAGYLTARRNRSNRFASGKAGDLIEQFFSEIIRWAVNDLSSYRADDRAILQLQRRIDYLDAIVKSDIFRYARVSHEHGCRDTIHAIIAELRGCSEYTQLEMQRSCAREKLEVLKVECESIMQAVGNWIYHFRGGVAIYEPFVAAKFTGKYLVYKPYKPSSTYAAIRATETGKILLKMVVDSGLRSFGALDNLILKGETEAPVTKEDEDKESDEETKEGLPDWLDTPELKGEFLKKIERLAREAVKMSQVLTLVSQARHLAGDVGDYWAYGDNLGRLSLKTLLHVSEGQLQRLDAEFSALQERIDGLRSAYTMRHQVTPGVQAHTSDYSADNDYKLFVESAKRLRLTVGEVSTQLNTFQKNSERNVLQRKHDFYISLYNFLSENFPENAEAIDLLRQQKKRGLPDLCENNAGEKTMRCDDPLENKTLPFLIQLFAQYDSTLSHALLRCYVNAPRTRVWKIFWGRYLRHQFMQKKELFVMLAVCSNMVLELEKKEAPSGTQEKLAQMHHNLQKELQHIEVMQASLWRFFHGESKQFFKHWADCLTHHLHRIEQLQKKHEVVVDPNFEAPDVSSFGPLPEKNADAGDIRKQTEQLLQQFEEQDRALALCSNPERGHHAH